MGAIPHRTNQQASQAPLTRADRFQIALALHTPVERDTQTFAYRELSEEELDRQADLLVQAFQARTLFLDGEILTKEGFAEAVREHYAIAYRGMAVAHQFVGDLGEESGLEEEGLLRGKTRLEKGISGIAAEHRREPDS